MSCRRIVTADPTILGGLSAIRQLDYESVNVAVNVRVARK